MSGMMGYLQRLFTWIEPEKDGPVNKEYELSEAYMQLAKNMKVTRERRGELDHSMISILVHDIPSSHGTR